MSVFTMLRHSQRYHLQHLSSLLLQLDQTLTGTYVRLTPIPSLTKTHQAVNSNSALPAPHLTTPCKTVPNISICHMRSDGDSFLNKGVVSTALGLDTVATIVNRGTHVDTARHDIIHPCTRKALILNTWSHTHLLHTVRYRLRLSRNIWRDLAPPSPAQQGPVRYLNVSPT